MEFTYNREKISTQSEMKISVADIRDLIQASALIAMINELALGEYQLIIDCILRKTHLEQGVISVVA